MSLEAWLYLLPICFLVSLAPGPGALSSVAQTITHGLARNLLNILGLQVALLIHLTMVMVGLSTLVVASATAFNTIKLAGAAYLVWLGVQRWLHAASFGPDIQPARSSSLFQQGLFVNLINPKSLLFFTALLPQLIDLKGRSWAQALILAVTIVGVDSLVMFSYGLFASGVRRFLSRQRFQLIANRLLGSLYIIIGGALLTARR